MQTKTADVERQLVFVVLGEAQRGYRVTVLAKSDQYRCFVARYQTLPGVFKAVVPGSYHRDPIHGKANHSGVAITG
jgi:hypothetical protein